MFAQFLSMRSNRNALLLGDVLQQQDAAPVALATLLWHSIYILLGDTHALAAQMSICCRAPGSKTPCVESVVLAVASQIRPVCDAAAQAASEIPGHNHSRSHQVYRHS